MSPTDNSAIERLRKENLDQFLTLVRMHLSFVVDINTDDVDNSADKPKQFRWNFHKIMKNSSSSNQNNLSNVKTSTETQSITDEGILRVYELIDFLSNDENVIQEGIFRRTGSLSRQQELRQLLMSGSTLELDKGRFSVHDCASVLKGFLAELPQPLLMEQYYQTYCTLAVQYPPNAETSETKLLTALQLLLLLLTPLHRNFLQRLLKLLNLAANHETSNRMSPDTLATMFTPHLLCPRKLSPEAFHTDSVALAPVVSFMIRHSVGLFEAPEQLATDIAAYFTIRERKRLMSPDIDLDESITDRTAASTVYTFVDRRRTGAENSSNPTDAALAQLYAHIQALPDSQHKRKLIKQFNRQNGYGTPIQIQRTGKVAGSRSFGDSIKRHIFSKGLLNKTPKKVGSSTVIHTVEEKLTSINKEKLKFVNDDNAKTMDVCHKNIVLKNLANKMASTESLDENLDFDSDASNGSTVSESGTMNRTHKLSPKFVSEPNLSTIDRADEETPKNTKKAARLFRSKVLAKQSKKYQKKLPLRGTPTCVSCFDDPDTESDNEICPKMDGSTESMEIDRAIKLNYLTSTPGISDVLYTDDGSCSTPYSMNFRRASMSPITKSTQKLSKAMQESIMTPRSRKPLIVTSGQRESVTVTEAKEHSSQSPDDVYQSMSPKNDSDFVSSDEDVTTDKITDSTLNKTSVSANGVLPKFRISQECNATSLTKPFKEYLLSRSVLTATPVDLSLNRSNDIDNSTEKISDSLMYCLDGNVPTDLTSSINSLIVSRSEVLEKSNSRSPLKNINNYLNTDLKSPNRKRTANSIACSDYEDNGSIETKKVLVDKENVFELRETDL